MRQKKEGVPEKWDVGNAERKLLEEDGRNEVKRRILCEWLPSLAK